MVTTGESLRVIIPEKPESSVKPVGEALLKVVSEHSPLGIYILQDGEFQYANPQFQRGTGYTQDELLDTKSLKYVFPDDREMVRANAVAMLKGRRLFPYEYRFVAKSGEIKWVMETVTSINYLGRRAVLGNYMDMTEYKQLERKMIEYEELNRLKSELLSLVSHELRTPLAAIKGYATMLFDYSERMDDGEKQEYLQSIDRAADRLTDLVDHLLDMSRLEAGLLKLKKVATDVTKLIHHAVAEAHIVSPDHKITVQVRRRLPRVMADPKRVRQILDNLINNACKYSEAGTEIIVAARRIRGELEISVSDRGVGIPGEELERVFDRMYRIEQRLGSEFGGIGLGLAICKGLVEAHGGRIRVKSKVEQGSVFSFTFPLSKSKRLNDEARKSREDGSRH